MKIQIRNFGPIEDITIDLEKDFHLLYGENAVGKSYAMYVVYGLLKNLKNILSNSDIFDLYDDVFNEIYDKEFENITLSEGLSRRFQLEDDLTPISITTQLHNVFNRFFNDIITFNLSSYLSNTFSFIANLENQYSHKPFEIIFGDRLLIFSNEPLSPLSIGIIEKGESVFPLYFHSAFFNKEITISKIKDNEDIKYIIYEGEIELDNAIDDEDLYTLLEDITFGLIRDFLVMLDKNIHGIHFLPSSRSGLYQGLNALSPIIAELSQKRHLLKNKHIELPSLPEPISDYYIDISTVNKNHTNTYLSNVVNEIEENVLRGRVQFDDNTKKIYYTPNGLSLQLELSEVSSMVAELSPIILYLKHILVTTKEAKSYTYLFIEEPEAHLHPEMQVKLIEIFAKLSQFNVKLFITTHSNYMFNKLNNMILDKKTDTDKLAVYHLVMTPTGSVVNENMKVTEEGINDDNFQQTAIKLYEERMHILENQ